MSLVGRLIIVASVLSLVGCKASTSGPGSDASDGAIAHDGPTGEDRSNDLPVAGDHPSDDTGGQQDAAAEAGRDAVADAPLVSPTITGLVPPSLPVGTPGTNFTLLVNGRDFPQEAEVAFDGNVWRAEFVSNTQLRVSIPTIALGITPRQVPVIVERVPSPQLSSNTFHFEVTAADAGQGN